MKPIETQVLKKSNLKHDPDVKRPGKTSSIYLNDELSQYKIDRQAALERNLFHEVQEPFKNYIPHRIFINHVDSFFGQHFTKYIVDQVTKVPNVEQDTLSDKDEDELLGTGEEAEDDARTDKREFFYEVIGTIDHLHYPQYRRVEGIVGILDQEKITEFLNSVLDCGIIIYDITTALNCHPLQIEEAALVLESMLEKLESFKTQFPRAFQKFKQVRTFILISTVLTWANTKPIDPNDPDVPFTEDDFRRRKPHPNYRKHLDFEKRVIQAGKLFPRHLRTFVIGSGVPYGHEEDVLDWLFKLAWSNEPELPVFAPGNNVIPAIHIDSLVQVTHLVLENFPARYKYVLAVDQNNLTLRSIVKAISKSLGSGKTVKVSREEAFLYKDVTQRVYDMLTVNLNMSPVFIVEKINLKWSSELPFDENISKLVKEYRIARNLIPFKLFLHGPPACGKTDLAKRLAQYYNIHYLNVRNVIEDGVKSLKDKIEELKDKAIFGGGEEGEESDEELQEEDVEDEVEKLEIIEERLKLIEDNMMKNEDGRLDDDIVLELFRARLLSKPCQNQGFVIDGYPKTLELTKLLYAPPDDDGLGEEEGDDEMGEDEGESPQGDVTKYYNTKIMPSHVHSLDISDELLIRRVISLPEKYFRNEEHFEEELCRKLREFRELNTEDNTALTFYDQLDVNPVVHSVENGSDLEMERIFLSIVASCGPARLEDMSEELRKKEEMAAMEELKKKEEEARKRANERRELMEEWVILRNQDKEMEERAMSLLSLPLRHYLMKNIFPLLTRGLVEVARYRPADPVDYLAEFLFKENPEAKMFYPEQELTVQQNTEGLEKVSMVSSSTKDSSSASETRDMSCESGVVSHGSQSSRTSSKTSRPSVKLSSRISSSSSSTSSPSSPPSPVRGVGLGTTDDSCNCSTTSSKYSASCKCPPTSVHCPCPL